MKVSALDVYEKLKTPFKSAILSPRSDLNVLSTIVGNHTVDQIEKIMRDLTKDFEDEQQTLQPHQSTSTPLTSIFRMINPSDRLSTDLPFSHRSTHQDWSDLIDRVRMAASRVKEAEADAQEQEVRVRELLDRVREDMKIAHDRIRVAETHAQEIQNRSDALLKAAETRVKDAEDRARTAEAWLAKISATIAEEFAAKDERRLTA